MSTPGIGPIAMVSDDLARSEHARRERAWSPAVRWQVIQETIAWAAAQATVHRNTPAASKRWARGCPPALAQWPRFHQVAASQFHDATRPVLRLEPIADTADGMDQPRREPAIDLASHPGNVDIDHIGHAVPLA
jgi:hypothetical protein